MILDIEPTTNDQQSLYEDVQRRNYYRKNAQLPLIDVQETYERELALIRAAKFKHILRPYIRHALTELPSPSGGIFARMGHHHRAVAIAYDRLIADYGCRRADLPL